MDRKQKQQERAEYYREKAQKAQQESTNSYERSNAAMAGIVPGQQILVGYHSEKRHRRALERSWNAMGESVKQQEKAEYYEAKARAAESNTSVYLGDDDAVERLRAKIQELEKLQEKMKAANKIIRSKKLTQEQKQEQLQQMGFSEDAGRTLFKPDFCGRISFPDYKITNNGANIRRYKKQLERAESLKSMEYKEYEVCGITVVEDPAENRFRIYFGHKPADPVREKLKKHGIKPRKIDGEWWWVCTFNRWYMKTAKEIIQEFYGKSTTEPDDKPE